MWDGADSETSFTISDVDGTVITMEMLTEVSGVMTQCWDINQPDGCLIIDITAPEGFTWDLYTPLDEDTPALSGTHEDTTFGELCVLGCTDAAACNYGEAANVDDGSCEYPAQNADCDGNCNEDSIGLTLTWSGADAATSFTVTGLDGTELTNQMLTEGEGSMTECWLLELQADCFFIDITAPEGFTWELVSPLAENTPVISGTHEDMTFGDECVYGCMDETACNYDATLGVNVDDGSCEYPAQNADCDGNCNEDSVGLTLTWSGADAETSFIVTGLDGTELTNQMLTEGDGSMTQCWLIALQENCLFIDITAPEGFTWELFSPLAENTPVTSGTHEDATFGELCVYGCMDETACNYDATLGVNVDDGTCEYLDDCGTCDSDLANDCVLGCTDSAACNYNELATDDDGSCTYVDGDCETCENGVIVDNDADDDGVCDADEIEGCMDSSACNYDSSATDDDGSCTYVDGVCETCENGVIVDNDADDDGVCDADEIEGCMDSSACNYDSSATDDDGSCQEDGPLTPAINQISSTILTVTEEHVAYQWHRDGVAIPDATEQTLLIFNGGNYQATVFDAAGCESELSNGILYGTEDEEVAESRMSIYPNPSDGLIYLESSKELGAKYFVEIYDNLGRLVLTKDNQALQLNILSIDVSMLKESIYNVVVKYDNGKLWNTTLIKK